MGVVSSATGALLRWRGAIAHCPGCCGDHRSARAVGDTMRRMPPHDQPWLAFSRVRWRGGFDRRLVRIFDDRIEVRAGRFAVETVVIPMQDVYDVGLREDGALRVVAVPDDVVVEEGTERDRALAADLIRRNAPPPREKPAPPEPPAPPAKPDPPPAPQPKRQPPPEPKPKPQPRPEPEPEPEPESEPEPAPRPPSPTRSAREDFDDRHVGVPERPRRARALRALAILTLSTVAAAVLIVAAIGAFVWVVVRLVQG